MFDTLVKEVMFIKNKMNENPNYVYTGQCDGTDIDLGQLYFVILKNGTYFYLAYYSDKLPEFTENDIAYIRKKVRDDDDYEVDCDTIMGEFKCASGTLYYDKLPMTYFNASIEFNTGCYDEEE